jgi:hypothetical protein
MVETYGRLQQILQITSSDGGTVKSNATSAMMDSDDRDISTLD